MGCKRINKICLVIAYNILIWPGKNITGVMYGL